MNEEINELKSPMFTGAAVVGSGHWSTLVSGGRAIFWNKTAIADYLFDQRVFAHALNE